MIVALVEGPAAPGERIELPQDEARHLRVRRVNHGSVILRDGRGFVGEGTLEQSGSRVFVSVLEAASAPLPPQLVLGVGAGDRERFATVAEKAAELGVTRLVPLETTRTVSVATRVRDDQLMRLRRRSLEAIKQSGSAWAPEIDDVTPVDEFIARHAHAAGDAPGPVLWLADPAGAPPPPTVAAGTPIVIVVGPEGGLSPGERSAALGRGYVPVWLAPHVLRFETAAIAALAAASIARRRGSA